MPTEDPLKLWQHIHGACAHFPIAMIITSFIFDLGAMLFKNRSWRTVAFWVLVMGAVVAVPAILSGLWGGQGWFGLKPSESESVLLHRNVSLIGGGVVIALALWRGLRRDALKGGEWAAYFVALVLATAAIGYTGWLGAYVQQGY